MFCRRKATETAVSWGILLPSCHPHSHAATLLCVEMFTEAMGGEASREVIAELERLVPKWREQLRHLEDRFLIEYCSIYVAPGKERSVDYYFEVVPLPRYFQWNIFNHTSLEKACFDIDGVLCVDPLPEENDDGPRYKQFLQTAAPLFLPGARIGTLVTSRLEKYRNETESWLRKNGVRYNQLVMLDLPHMEARRQANNHAIHKAKTYASGQYTLFVESDPGQAADINLLTKKPVFCTARFEMVYHSESLTYNLKSGKHLPLLRKYALKMREWLRKININRSMLAPSPKIN
jgi:uncharacterized HAD superfamily protein